MSKSWSIKPDGRNKLQIELPEGVEVKDGAGDVPPEALKELLEKWMSANQKEERVTTLCGLQDPDVFICSSI
jgi:hypothetical protein